MLKPGCLLCVQSVTATAKEATRVDKPTFANKKAIDSLKNVECLRQALSLSRSFVSVHDTCWILILSSLDQGSRMSIGPNEVRLFLTVSSSAGGPSLILSTSFCHSLNGVCTNHVGEPTHSTLRFVHCSFDDLHHRFCKV